MTTPTSCAVYECIRPTDHPSALLCPMHRRRVSRGQPLGAAGAIEPVHPYLRLARCSTTEGDCWIYIYKNRSRKYWSLILPGAKSVVAHRWAYEYFVGEIPAGLQLDHLCRNPSCWNPWHLDPVTPSVNTGRQPNARRSRTHCPQGHPYDQANTYTSPRGSRSCRVCHRAAVRRSQQRRRAAA